MHHVLCDGGEKTQRKDREDNLNRRVECEGKDASKADHKQHCPGETALANNGSQALPKAVHRTLRSAKPKVAKVGLEEGGLRKGTYHDQPSRAFAQ